MQSIFKYLCSACFVVTLSAAAQAADLDLPDPVIEHEPTIVPVAESSHSSTGLYLRGDIGYAFYNKPDGTFDDPVTGELRYERESMDDAWMVGVGVGYKFNKYFRSDFTVDYKSRVEAKALAPCTCAPGSWTTEGSDISVWSFMFNGYVDLGTWNRITPYVGAGIGASYVSTSDTYSISSGGTIRSEYDGTNTEWNIAWSLMAGAQYALTDNWSLDAGYQYSDLGDAKTVRRHGFGTGGTKGEWRDITSHEVRLGVRYNFGNGAQSETPSYYQPAGPISSNF